MLIASYNPCRANNEISCNKNTSQPFLHLISYQIIVSFLFFSFVWLIGQWIRFTSLNRPISQIKQKNMHFVTTRNMCSNVDCIYIVFKTVINRIKNYLKKCVLVISLSFLNFVYFKFKKTQIYFYALFRIETN